MPKLMALRSKKDNFNSSAVLADKTNVENTRPIRKVVKPVKNAKNIVTRNSVPIKNKFHKRVLKHGTLLVLPEKVNNENESINQPENKNVDLKKITKNASKKNEKSSNSLRQILLTNNETNIVPVVATEKTLQNEEHENKGTFKKPLLGVKDNESIPNVKTKRQPKIIKSKSGMASETSTKLSLAKEKKNSIESFFKKPGETVSNKTQAKNTPAGTKPKRQQKITNTSAMNSNKSMLSSVSASIKENVKPNYYGFEDSDFENDQSPCKTEFSKFDCSKPYRLALYVKPSRTIRINPALAKKMQSLNPSLNLTNYSMIDSTIPAKKTTSESFMSPNRSNFKVPFSSTPLPVKKTATKLVQRKITDVIKMSPKKTRAGNSDREFKSFFEKSLTSDEEASPPSREVKKRTSDEVISSPPPREVKKIKRDDSICSEVSDDKEETVIPVSHVKKSRRSYVKKAKPIPEPEPEDEPPSDDILKSIEKVKKKGKSKKNKRDDEEFEKWSKSMNSMFSEVDQFEISFG